MYCLLLLFSGCVSQSSVEKSSLQYLEAYYKESFEIVSVDMQKNAGNYGTARLEIQPLNKPDLKFQLNYNYSKEEVSYDGYRKVLWEKDLRERLERKFPALKQSSERYTGIRIDHRNSLGTLTKPIRPGQKMLEHGIAVMENPSAKISMNYSDQSQIEKRLSVLSEAAAYVRQYGFKDVQFVAFSAPATSDHHDHEQIQAKLGFRLYGKLPAPSQSELRQLIHKKGDPYLAEKTKPLFDKAESLRTAENNAQALAFYKSIIETYDNPYRYNPYIVAQSSNVYESMLAAAEISEELGQAGEAIRYYELFIERVETEDTKLKFHNLEKSARKRLKALQ